MRHAILALLLLAGTAPADGGKLIAENRPRFDLTARARNLSPAEWRGLRQWLDGRSMRAVADVLGPPDESLKVERGRTVWLIKFRSEGLGIEFERGRVIDFGLIVP